MRKILPILLSFSLLISLTGTGYLIYQNHQLKLKLASQTTTKLSPSPTPSPAPKPSQPNFEQISFNHLIANAQQYHNQSICTKGIYLSSFETSALGASTYQENNTVYLKGPTIWMTPNQISSQTNCTTNNTKPSVKYCQVTACGNFESQGQYGHLGSFQYQLTSNPQPDPTSPPISCHPCPHFDHPEPDYCSKGILISNPPDECGCSYPPDCLELTCPQNGWINCMPKLSEKGKLKCSKSAIDWYQTNCPDFKGTAH